METTIILLSHPLADFRVTNDQKGKSPRLGGG
jgi:hypothetical protein